MMGTIALQVAMAKVLYSLTAVGARGSEVHEPVNPNQ